MREYTYYYHHNDCYTEVMGQCLEKNVYLDSAVKPKDTNKTNGTTKPNKNVISVLKSDIISVLKPDDHLDDFFGDSTKSINEESTVQLNTDDLNKIAQNTVRLQSQTARVRPPRRQQQGAKNPLRQIQATIPTETEYTEVHTNLSEQELRRLKRAQSTILFLPSFI